MTDSTAAKTAKGSSRRGRPFELGKSGNPSGRPRGSKNKHVIWEMLERAGGCTPLEFFLLLMNDTERPINLRLKAALAAAPYLHGTVKPCERVPDLDGDRPLTAAESMDLMFGPI
jgi:hypothetical protein